MIYDKIDPIEEEIRKFTKRCDRIILHHRNQEEFHTLREIENKEKRRVVAEKDLNSLET